MALTHIPIRDFDASTREPPSTMTPNTRRSSLTQDWRNDMNRQEKTRRDFLKTAGTGMAALGVLSVAGSPAFGADSKPVPDLSRGADNFYKSKKVTTRKVTFNNQYRMKIVG